MAQLQHKKEQKRDGREPLMPVDQLHVRKEMKVTLSGLADFREAASIRYRGHGAIDAAVASHPVVYMTGVDDCLCSLPCRPRRGARPGW